MKINVTNFKELLRKSTMNFSISTLRLSFGGGKIKSNMVSDDGRCIVMLDVGNDVLSTNDEIDFNLSEPAQNVVPYLNLFDDDEADIQIFENRIVIKDGEQKSNIGFCSPLITEDNLLGSEGISDEITWLAEIDIDDDFISNFTKIKKIGSRFQKVYFEIKDSVLSIETTDKTNSFSNGLKFNISEVDCDKDIILCLSFKDMVNFMNVVEEGFTLKLTYNDDQELGMVYAENTDKSEKYCILSQKED